MIADDRISWHDVIHHHLRGTACDIIWQARAGYNGTGIVAVSVLHARTRGENVLKSKEFGLHPYLVPSL